MEAVTVIGNRATYSRLYEAVEGIKTCNTFKWMNSDLMNNNRIESAFFAGMQRMLG